MNYYIFRHGETYESLHNIDYKIDNVYSAELLPEAKEKTIKIANYLKSFPTDRNFTSGYPRCVKTSAIVSNITGKKFETDDRLGEFLKQKNESFESFSGRVENFTDEIKKLNYNAVAICTHGGVIAALKHFIIKGSFELPDLQDYPRPGILVKIIQGKIEYLDFNQN